MQTNMVDDEDQRRDRHEQAGDEQKPERYLPNRRQRRLKAKARGVFRSPGAWPYVNTGIKKQQPRRRDDSNED